MYYVTLQLGNELDLNPYYSIAYVIAGFIFPFLIYNPKKVRAVKKN